MISSEGILSTKSPTIYLDGAMEMLNGTITQAITLCSNGECDNVFLSRTFKPYATNIMEITDQSGALSLMVIVNKDPLITHTLNASYTEVDVWEEVDPFTRNAAVPEQAQAQPSLFRENSQNSAVAESSNGYFFGALVGKLMEKLK